MAFGALEALRAAGLAGKIPVVGVDGVAEAVAAVDKGEMVATVSSDGYYQGSIGLAMGVCVLTGQVPPPKRLAEGKSRILSEARPHHQGERSPVHERSRDAGHLCGFRLGMRQDLRPQYWTSLFRSDDTVIERR